MAAYRALTPWAVVALLAGRLSASGAAVPPPKSDELAWRKPAPAMPETASLPPACSARLGRLLLPVDVLAISPNGRLFVTAHKYIAQSNQPAPLHLWDATTGTHLRVLKGHHTRVLCAAFSPDGSILASGGQDDTLRFWDTATGKQRCPARELFLGHSAYTVFFTPDGKRVISNSSVVQLWDADTGRELYLFEHPWRDHSEFHTLAALSPDGRSLVTGTGYTLRLWEVATGKMRSQRASDADWNSHGLAFAPDGKTPLISHWPTLQVVKWELATIPFPKASGKRPPVARHGRFSPDGRRMVWAANDWRRVRKDGILGIVDTATGKEIRRIWTPSEPYSYIFSTDGKTLAAGGWDGSLRFFDVASGKLLRTPLEPLRPVFALHFSGARNLLSLTSDGGLHDWDATAARERRQGRLHLPAGEFLLPAPTNGPGLVTVRKDGTLRLWDLTTGKEGWQASRALRVREPRPDPAARRVKPGHKEELPEPVPDVTVALSAAGRFLAGVTGDGGRVTVWDTTGKKNVSVSMKDVSALALSPKGDKVFLAACDAKGPLIRVWAPFRRAEGRLIRLPPGPPLKRPPPRGRHRHGEVDRKSTIVSLLLSPDGKTLAGVERAETTLVLGFGYQTVISWRVHFWDTGRMRLTVTVACESPSAVTFSPDGRLLALAQGDRIVIVDAVRGIPFKPEGGHSAVVTSLAFSPDGKTLASGSEDATILLWDTAKITR